VAGEALAAGIDVGTSRVKLYVYDSEGRLVLEKAKPSPLHWARGEAWHDSSSLKRVIEEFAGLASDRGARAVGISLYRASVAAWRPGGSSASRIILWLDRRLHREAWRGLPLRGRLASRLPVYGRILAPYSPLPLIASLRRRLGPGWRVWTLDALVHEWIGAGYVSEPTGAALTGLVNPRNLKPIPLASWLAGAGGAEWPLIGHNTLPQPYNGVTAIISDQQSGLVGLGCLRPGCLKLSLGTGFFADRPLEGPPPLVGGAGLLPIVVYRTPSRGMLWGVEAYAPGAGLGVEGFVEAIGGWPRLESASLEACSEWEGGLIIPYPSGPGAGLGAHRVVVAGNPLIRGGWDAVCSVIGGIVSVAAMLASEAAGPARDLYLTGSIAGIRLVRALISAAADQRVWYCEEDPTPRGAAILAAEAMGGELPPAGCVELGKGGGGLRRISEAFRCVIRRGVLDREADACLEDLRSLLGDLASSLDSRVG
jgi:glycerol kinase